MGRKAKPAARGRWFILADTIVPGEYQQAVQLWEEAERAGVPAELVEVRPRDESYRSILQGAAGLILYLHDPGFYLDLISDITTAAHLRRCPIIVAIRSSRYDRMKLLWQDRPVTYPPVVTDPETRVIVEESLPVEMILGMITQQTREN